jgi:hypothetical protein
MSTVAIAAPPVAPGFAPGPASLPDFVLDCFRDFFRTCDGFLDWERENVLRVEPSAETLTRHRDALKWLLRLARIMHCGTSDAEFPDRSLARELSARLRQLEESWTLVHERMPEAEADAILKQVFPDAS